MPAIIPFIPLIVGGISGGVSVGTALYQANKNEDIANSQLSAADRAAQRESDSFDKSIKAAEDERDYNRWLTQATAEARQPYLDALAESIGAGFGSYAPSTYTPQTYTAPTYEAAKPFVAPDPKDIESDPGYQHELGQGVEAINRSGAARGTLLTGGTLKDAQSFGQGLAATRAGEKRDRALQEYSLAESLRQSTFDRNAANQFNAAQFNNQSGFNAAQLNNQSAYQAASLANQGASARLSALGSLASLALPKGAYPGSTSGGDQKTLPVRVNQFGVPLPNPVAGAPTFYGGGYDPNAVSPIDIGAGYETKDPNNLYGDEDTTPWSGALRRRNF